MAGDQTLEDAEFSAMRTIYTALEPLEETARARVVDYVSSRLGIVTNVNNSRSATEEDLIANDQSFHSQNKTSFGTVAELFDATQPKSNAEKALIAAYWLQVCQNTESFDGQSANKELKHLGHGLANITSSIDGLKNQKPALVLQLKKSGTTRQARKIYKITTAGIKAVEDMIHG